MSHAIAQPPPAFMTVDEFMAWDCGDGLAYQLIDGQPVAMAPSTVQHGLLQGEVFFFLRSHLLDRRPDCRIVIGPGVIPALFSAHNMRVPDLAVSCATSEAREAGDDRSMADPVLLIEILSPSNQAETWANVWAYTTIPSVREILVLRADMITAHLLRRAEGGACPAEPERIADGDLMLDSVGFSAPLAELYRTTRLARPAT